MMMKNVASKSNLALGQIDLLVDFLRSMLTNKGCFETSKFLNSLELDMILSIDGAILNSKCHW